MTWGSIEVVRSRLRLKVDKPRAVHLGQVLTAGKMHIVVASSHTGGSWNWLIEEQEVRKLVPALVGTKNMASSAEPQAVVVTA